MTKAVLKIFLLLFVFQLEGFFSAYASNFPLKNAKPTHYKDAVAVHSNNFISNISSYYETVEIISLEAIEDLLEEDEDDERHFLRHKKDLNTGNYLFAHYTSNSFKAACNYSIKYCKTSTCFSFSTCPDKYVLFCVFRI